MISQFKKCKSDIDECFETLNIKEFEIYDCEDEKRCFIKSEDSIICDSQIFRVENENLRDITFVAFDKCIFDDSDNFSKCDCIISDNKKVCFVELKKTKTSQRSTKVKQAIKELKESIKKCKDKIDFKDFELEAYYCVGSRKVVPSKSSSRLNDLVEFEEELNTILFEGCEKKF